MTAHEHILSRPGESTVFHLDSTWWIPAAEDRVWEVLAEISSWSQWWHGMTRSLRRDGTAWLEVRSPLGYRLNLVLTLLSETPRHSARFTVDGDLRGVGSVLTAAHGSGTRVDIMGCVVTRRRLIGRFRLLARWAHAVVMAAGRRGLRRATES